MKQALSSYLHYVMFSRWFGFDFLQFVVETFPHGLLIHFDFKSLCLFATKMNLIQTINSDFGYDLRIHLTYALINFVKFRNPASEFAMPNGFTITF